MTDYYNNEGVNTQALEKFIAELESKRRSKRRDAVLLVFLGLFGLSGFLVVFNPLNTNGLVADASNQTPNSGLYADDSAEPIAKAVKVNLSPSSTSSNGAAVSKPLVIDGDFQVGKLINFTINGFDPNNSYELDLGNGTTMTTMKNQISFAYPENGQYVVTLSAMKNKQPLFQYKEQVNIIK